MFLLKLIPKESDRSIIELASERSPILGTTLGLAMVVFFLTLAFVYLRDFINYFGLVLPLTPMVVFGLLLVLLGVYSIKQGLEVLSRLSALLIVPALILVTAGIIPNLFTIESAPILIPLESWKHTLKGAILQLSNFGELVVLTMLLPLTKRSEHTARYVIIPICFTGLLITVLAYTLYGNFGANTARITFKLSELYSNISRIESLFIVLWISTFLIKVSVFFYVAVKGLSEVLNLKKHEPLVFPAAVIITFLSVISFVNYTDYFVFFTRSLPYFRLLVELGVPLLFLLIMLAGRSAVKA